MKKRFLTAAIAVATVFFASCSSEDALNNAFTSSNLPVTDSTANPFNNGNIQDSTIAPIDSSTFPNDTITTPIDNPNIPQSSSSDDSGSVMPQSSSDTNLSSSLQAVSSSSLQIIEPKSSSSSEIIPASSSSIIASSSSKTPSSSSKVESSSSAIVLEAPSRKSVGCGKALSIKTGFYKIQNNGKNREYAIDVPANYDPNKPYRLIYTSHWIWSKAADVVNGNVSNGGAANWAFFGLKRVLDSAGVQAVFIAPTADGGIWGEADHALFDNLLKHAKENLCIDTGLVFATGFSFGAMQTFSLSTNHQKDLRAVATLAAANYNIWLPTNTHQKIAYLGITGMSDGTCPFIQNAGQKKGGFYAATLHAEDNGCEVPANIPTTNVGSKSHLVYDFKNCDEGYPVRYITFDGGHIAAPTDGQTSDDGRRTWAPHETWKFFSQFK